MKPTFWSNTIWYILLCATSIISFAIMLYKSNNRKFITGFTCAVLGSTYFLEVGLLTLTNSYSYLPKISSKPFVDSVFGNYFSQLSVTTTAVLVTVFKLSTIWSFIFAGIYYLIEELFLKLGIYQHHWYKSWYTYVGIIVVIWVVKKWYHTLFNLHKKYIYYISLFFAARGMFSTTIYLWFYVFSIKVFNINLHTDFYRGQAILVVSFMAILTIIMIIVHSLKLKLMWKSIIFIFLFVVQYVLTKIGYINIKNGWFVAVTLLDLLGCYFWVAAIDYLLSKSSNSRRREHFNNCCSKRGTPFD